MSQFFDPTPEARRALEKAVKDIPEIQKTFLDNHKQLTRPDRAAHQQQLAGGKVLLEIAAELPAELNGLGLFQRAAGRPVIHTGIGRVSTGLGCPHAETDPDFLGLMAAFRTPAGRRVDFLSINSAAAPTDTVAEFIALLKATAEAAGTEIPLGDAGELDLGNFVAMQSRFLLSLARHAGTKAPGIARDVTRQTARTAVSSSAYQQYWTGIVRARDVLGKFTFVPAEAVNGRRSLTPGAKHLSKDWRDRQSRGALAFRLYWIPFVSEKRTPLKKLTDDWAEDHRVAVGTVTFPMTDPASMQAKLAALLAFEIGANPGNWVSDDRPEADEFPATEFTAARLLAYRLSQQGRSALPEAAYNAFFESGEIGRDLATELIARYNTARAAGHGVPDIGDIALASAT
jgi:hypothetical protein